MWHTYAQCVTRDVTVHVPGVDYFTFNLAPQKYHPYITLSTVTTNNVNLDTNTPEVCVGQNVAFQLAFDPSLSYLDLAGQWHLPDKFVNEGYTPFVLFSPKPTLYRVNDGLLRNTNATSCWYVNGHGGGVSIGANLHFSNGQYVSIAAMGDFTVHRPSSSDFVRIANEFVWDAPELTGDMQWKVKLNSKYDGLFGTTQLLSADGGLYDTGGSVFLDGDSEIYGEPDSKGIAKSYILLSTDPLAHITSLFDTPRPGPIDSSRIIVGRD